MDNLVGAEESTTNPLICELPLRDSLRSPRRFISQIREENLTMTP